MAAIRKRPERSMVERVREEASRRMRLFTGARDKSHLQQIIANASREAIRLQQIKVGTPDPLVAGAWVAAPREWTQGEMLRVNELMGADQFIEAIRTASNALEAMDPIPSDYDNDAYWPANPA